MTVFDLDDFSVVNHQLPLLDELSNRIEGFKVTLFTVPMPEGFHGTLHDHAAWLLEVQSERPWVEYAMHGYHHSYLECRNWSFELAREYLMEGERAGVFRLGFKGPYWEMSPGTYEALRARGWWVADHDRNDHMRPADLRGCYKIDRPGRVHGHVQNIGSNGLVEAWDTYVAMRGPFRFVSEEVAQ